MAQSRDNGTKLSSLEQLRADLAAEEKRLAEEAERLAKRRALLAEAAELEKKFQAEGLAVTLSAETLAKAQPVPTEDTVLPWAKPTWQGLLLHLLESNGKPMRHDDLQRAAFASPIYPQLVPGLKNYYGTMERMRKRKLIVTKGGTVFTTKQYEEFLAQGKPPPTRGPRGKNMTKPLIMEILAHAPQGLTAAELHIRLGEVADGGPRRFKMGGAYITRSLDKRLQKYAAQGWLVAKDGVYRVPNKAKGQTLEASGPSKQLVRPGRPTTAGSPVEKGDLH